MSIKTGVFQFQSNQIEFLIFNWNETILHILTAQHPTLQNLQFTYCSNYMRTSKFLYLMFMCIYFPGSARWNKKPSVSGFNGMLKFSFRKPPKTTWVSLHMSRVYTIQYRILFCSGATFCTLSCLLICPYCYKT